MESQKHLPRFVLTAVAWSCLLSGAHSSVSAQDAPRTLLTFAAMGDVPYTPQEKVELRSQIEEIPDEAEFVIHLGDIKRGYIPCLEFMYRAVATVLKQSKKPVFIIPGDNEWNDCPRPEVGWANWMKHLHKLDEHWEHDFEVERQADREENFAMVRNGVLVIGLNLVGGRIFDRDQWDRMLDQDATWIEQQCDKHRDRASHVVIFGHANLLERHRAFTRRMEAAAREAELPVLYLHGDGHRWRYDRPFAAGNILRVQVDQGGIAPPVLVRVVDDEDEPFRFDRRQD